MSKEIVKIQLPLFNSDGNYSSVLIYNKSKSIHALIDLDRKMLDFIGPNKKQFWLCEIKDDKLNLIKRVSGDF